MAHRTNYFIGNDPDRWIDGLRSYESVRYSSVWDNIDVEFYFTSGELKYDVIVEPRGSVFDVQFRYHGPVNPELDGSSGDLMIQTPLGPVRETAPIAYQMIDGLPSSVPCHFVVDGSVVGFSIGTYDPDLPLVIDPGVSFVAGIGRSIDGGCRIDVDDEGYIYVTGRVNSLDFPTEPGVYETKLLSGRNDNFVLKMEPFGSTLVYATFFGGSQVRTVENQQINCIHVDENGYAYVGGMTNSTDFPTTEGAFDRDFNGLGNSADIFLLRLSPDGADLEYSTYLGGGGADVVTDIVVDDEGALFLTGHSYGLGFPTTPRAFDDDTYDDGATDVIVVKLSPDGSSLLYSTFIGEYTMDDGWGICIDEEGNAYVTGFSHETTTQDNFPTTSDAYQRRHKGWEDAFLAKVSPDGEDLLYSTYIGSNKSSRGRDIVMDDDGFLYIVGSSTEGLHTTADAYQPECEGRYDAFLVKFDVDRSEVLYSTYLGGSGVDEGWGISMDGEGRLFITGETWSSDLPTVLGSLDTEFGGLEDGFLSCLDIDRSELFYSTYIGASDWDITRDVLVDEHGWTYVSGFTNSTDFPFTYGAFNTVVHGEFSCYVMKIHPVISDAQPLAVPDDRVFYAGHRAYDIEVDANPTDMDDQPYRIRLHLDPGRTDVVLLWEYEGTSSTFTEERDPDDLVQLTSTGGDVEVDDANTVTSVHFRMVMDWSWPHEEFCSVRTEISMREMHATSSYMTHGLFRVENDLDLVGDIQARGEWQGDLEEGDWVRAWENVTLHGPVVVYEGTTDVHPPAGVCNLSILDDDGDVASAPIPQGEPVEVTIQADPVTDVREWLDLNLTDLPGDATAVSSRTFMMRVDGDPPTLSNPVPDGDDWHSTSSVIVAITVEDADTSGVDPARVEYSYSTEGLDGFGEWTRVGLTWSGTDRTIDVQATVGLPDGDDNYVRWRAWDVVGNGPALSEPIRIRVDTVNVTFSDPVPDPTAWHRSLLLDCGVTITDEGGSGIDVTSIQYRFTTGNVSHYGPWSDWDEGSMTDARAISTLVAIEFNETPWNYVQWRAADIAGNGNTTSRHFRVMTDLTDPILEGFEPAEDVIVNTTAVRCRLHVSDGILGSGVDLSTLEYRKRTSPVPEGAASPEWSGWTSCGLEGTIEDGWVDFVVDLAHGSENLVQVRFHDVAGNGPVLSPEQTVTVDVEAPVIEVVQPDLEMKQPSVRVTISLRLSDSIAGVDPSEIWYRYGPNGSLGEWIMVSDAQGGESVDIELILDLEEGRDNRFQLRVSDTVGNTRTTEELSVWVNSAPTAAIKSPRDGATKFSGEDVRLSGEGSSDPDGDPLNYTWYLDDGVEPIGNGQRKDVRMQPGEHTLTLRVTDDDGAFDETTVAFEVTSTDPSPDSTPIPWWLLLIVIVVFIAVGYYLYRGRSSSEN